MRLLESSFESYGVSNICTVGCAVGGGRSEEGLELRLACLPPCGPTWGHMWCPTGNIKRGEILAPVIEGGVERSRGEGRRLQAEESCGIQEFGQIRQN